MRKRNFKGRCEKRQIAKCAEVCRTYDDIQRVYAERLSEREDIAEIRCNVPLDGLSLGDYTSDFVCLKTDGELMVRECVYRRFLIKPMTLKLLDASREYWLRHGVTDWGLVIDAGRAGGVPPVVFVEKVVVSGMNKDVQLVYLLRDGSEHKADCYFFKSSAKPRQTNCFRNLLD